MTYKHVIIDGDSIIYAAAAPSKRYCVVVANDEYYITGDEIKANKMAEKKAGGVKEEIPFYPPLSHCLVKAKTTLSKILENCGTESYTLYVAGKQDRNPKSQLYPEYKGHRDVEKPLYYSKVKKYLIEHWKAVECHNIEADDVVHTEYYSKWNENCIIASADKDVLYMTPGNKYNYRTHEQFKIEDNQAAFNFALYVLAGDLGDNIPGLYGFGEPEFEKGILVEKGKTLKELFKVKCEEGLNYEECLTSYLKGAYKIYKEQLKALPKKDLQKRFELTCKLLWLPVYGKKYIYDVVDFEEEVFE